MRELVHNTFVESSEMISVAISAFEAELLTEYWMGLVNAHNYERVVLATHSSCAWRQDHYAIQRCEAYIAAGLLSESDFEAIRERICQKFVAPDEEADMSAGNSGWARIRSDEHE